MKKRVVVLFLACVLALSGCTNQAPATDEAISSETETSAEAQSLESTQVTIEESSALPADEEVTGISTKGGNPWLNSDLKENIEANVTLSPKDDFHLFVNYDWLSKAELPEGYGTYAPFTAVADETYEKALAVLTDRSLKSKDAEQIQALYDAYMDWDARNALGVKPLKDTVDDILSIQNMDELADFICDPVRSFGVPTFIGAGNGNDLIDSSKYVLYVGTDGLTLGDAAEYKERTELGNLYYGVGQYLTTAMLTRIGYTEQEATKMFDDSIALEAKLAEHAYTNAEQMSPDYMAKIYNIYSMKDLEAASPAFPMTRFLNAFGYGKAKECLVAQPQVIQSVNEVYTAENLDVIKNYMIVKFARAIADSLDREAYEASVTASNMLNGTEGTLPDERVAFGVVNNMLGTPMNRAYLEKYDATETKARITELIHQIVAVYRDMLREEDWLSEETKALAIEKLDNLKINAVYPDKWLDCSSLDLKGLSYLDCQKAISDFSQALDVSHVNGRVDKELWSSNILDANAYYNPMDNSINIILGLLGGDFYHDGMSDEELLGGIGAVIGHEISHAFDTNGAQFDKDGNYANWWKAEDYAAFQERAAKLINYYNERTIWEGANFFGNNIQTEAIADMAGFKAMLKLAEGKENFDYEKFFKAYANIWKEIITYENEYYVYAQDSHPVNYLRTNATVQQFDEFLETFDVKEGDNMYLAPADRVLVW